MQSNFPARRTSPAAALCLLAALSWPDLAHAAKVTPPPRPVANQLLLVQPGEVPEERAKLTKKHNNKIKNKQNSTRDDS